MSWIVPKMSAIIFIFFFVGVVNFNSKYGCQKCTVLGEYSENRMSFPNFNAERRTNDSFRERKDKHHHKEVSPFEQLDMDMVFGFPTSDSLHLIDSGVMRRTFCMVKKVGNIPINGINNRLLLQINCSKNAENLCQTIFIEISAIWIYCGSGRRWSFARYYCMLEWSYLTKFWVLKNTTIFWSFAVPREYVRAVRTKSFFQLPIKCSSCMRKSMVSCMVHTQ